MTLIEISFALLVMALVMASGLITITSVVNTTGSEVMLGRSNDQIGLVVHELEAQAVSTDILFNPATEVAGVAGTNPDGSAIGDGWSLRLYLNQAGTPLCTQWRVLDTGVLQERSWTNTVPPVVGDWQDQMTGLLNDSSGGDPSQPPFQIDPQSSLQGRTLSIDLVVRTGTLAGDSAQFTTEVTARNAEFYQPSQNDTGICSPVPAP